MFSTTAFNKLRIMTHTDIKREVYSVLQEMGIPSKAITDSASFQKDLGLDSLDFAEMVIQFELRFNVDIPITEAEEITTVKEALEYIRTILQSKAVMS